MTALCIFVVCMRTSCVIVSCWPIMGRCVLVCVRVARACLPVKRNAQAPGNNRESMKMTIGL